MTNKDVLEMHTAGLSDDLITEKIKTSICDFDTSPSALVQFKTVGVSESVALAMMRCPAATLTSTIRSPSAAVVDPKAPNAERGSATSPRGYTVTYVKSGRKWKLSLNSEPFNQVSEDFDQQLAESLDKKGVHQTPLLETGCCRVTLELLEVTSHPAVFKKPGIDVSASVTITDATGRFIYSKGYRGESRTGFMRTWKHLITQAVGDMVKNVMEDENFMKVLATGQL